MLYRHGYGAGRPAGMGCGATGASDFLALPGVAHRIALELAVDMDEKVERAHSMALQLDGCDSHLPSSSYRAYTPTLCLVFLCFPLGV